LFTINVNLNLCNKVNKNFGFRFLKKTIRILKYVLFSLLFLIVILAVVVNTPFAHRIITGKVNDLFAKNGWPVHVGKLSLVLTGRIALNQLEIKSASGDTIVFAENVKVTFSPGALFSKRIVIRDADLKNVVVNLHTEDTMLLSLFTSSSPPVKNENSKKSSWDIGINQVQLDNIRFLYKDSLNGILIKQTLQKAELTFETFSLLKKQIDVNSLDIGNASGYLSVRSNTDSTKKVSSPQAWKFSARKVELNEISYVIERPDAMQRTSMSFKHAVIAVKELNLSKKELNVLQLNLSDPKVLVETSGLSAQNSVAETTVKIDTVDNNWSVICHLVNIKNGSFDYAGKDSDERNDLSQWLHVKEFTTEIKDVKYTADYSGCNVNQLSFGLNDEVYLKSGEINFLSDASKQGKLSMELEASVNSSRQKLFSNNDMVRFSSVCSGSTDSLRIEKCNFASASGIELSVSGYLTELLQLTESRCNLEFETGKISRDQTGAVIALLQNQISLPAFEPIGYSGSVSNSFLSPRFKVLMQSASGIASMEGNYDVNKRSGKLNASLTKIQLGKMFGDSYPESITANVLLNGGMNANGMLSGNGSVEVKSVLYQTRNYQHIILDLAVIDNQSTFSLVSEDTNLTCHLEGLFGWRGNESNGEVSGNFNLNSSHTNFLPGQISVQGNIAGDFRSKGKDIQSSVELKSLAISNSYNLVHIDSFLCNLILTDTLVHSKINSDFVTADFQSQSSFDELKKAAGSMDFKKMLSLDSNELMEMDVAAVMPVFNLTAAIRYDSLFQFIYPDSVFQFDTLLLAISKNAGDHNITGEGSLRWMKYSDYKTYGVKMLMRFDEHEFNFSVNIDSIYAANKRFGESGIAVNILPVSANGSLSVSSRDGKPLFQLGAEVLKQRDRVVMRSTDNDWILNGNKWSLSPVEFLFRENSSRDISADLHMVNGDVKIELTGRESEKMNLNLENVKLGALVTPELFKDLPDGLMNANVNYSGGANRILDFKFDVKNFNWKDVHLNYVESSGRLEGDSTGILVADISAKMNDTSAISLKFIPDNNPAEKKYRSEFSNIPVMLLQSTVGKYIDSLEGTASGELDLLMETERPLLDGEIRLKDVNLNVIKLKSHFSIPDDKLVVRHSRLNLDRFTILDSLQRPLYLDGTIAFENPDSITVDLNVKTDNLRVLNTTVKDDPNFFGTIILNSGLDISGPVKQPVIKGLLVLEKGTDITYKYIEDLSGKESERAVTFQKINLDSLVSNSQLGIKKVPGMPTIQTTIEIDPKSVFKIEYSSGFDIDVKVSGKGLLNYVTLPNNSISLAGSYDINSGTSELKFTGWPMKKFSITPGSSIRWDGAYADPMLNLEAISKVKGSYRNPIDNKDRTVDFIVSMKLLDQLSELKIMFDVKSNDQYITSVFSSLSSDEVMRQAINLLIFESVDLPGMESSTSYMSAQMNSFWESQLDNLTKTRVKNVDISFGVETHKQTSSSGAEEEKTSLSYEMDKKFLKDRASVKISGRLNDDVVEGKQSNNLIENFSFEYALDTMSKKYMKIYRKQDYEDILEGEVIKSGVGFIYRRSYPSLSDIWKRKAKKDTVTEPGKEKAN